MWLCLGGSLVLLLAAHCDNAHDGAAMAGSTEGCVATCGGGTAQAGAAPSAGGTASASGSGGGATAVGGAGVSSSPGGGGLGGSTGGAAAPNAGSAPLVGEPGGSSAIGVGGGGGGVDGGAGSSGVTAGAGSGSTGAGATGSVGGAAAGVDRDVFGIIQLYPSLPAVAEWTSQHWQASAPYAIADRTDENDPLGVSGMRGTGTVAIDATGDLVVGGSQPRLYIYGNGLAAWRDVEVTVYYQRVSDDGTAYAGLVIGARSGPEGHGSEPCDAHTYYSRLRQDGATDFAKELMHSSSTARNQVEPQELWPLGGELPVGTWIGWKFVVYNLAGGASVRLESYRDLTGGADGGSWELVNATTDDSGWLAQTTCVEQAPVDGESDQVALQAGAVLIRNTAVTEARYRWLTVREIAPPLD